MLIHFHLVNIMLKLLYCTELCRNSVLEKMMKFDKKPHYFWPTILSIWLISSPFVTKPFAGGCTWSVKCKMRGPAVPHLCSALSPFHIWSLLSLLPWLLSVIKFSAANSISGQLWQWTCSSCVFLDGAEKSKAAHAKSCQLSLAEGVEEGSAVR